MGAIVFLSSWLVGMAIYGTFSAMQYRMFRQRQRLGILNDDTDHALANLDARGVLPFALVFSAFMFPLSLAYDWHLQNERMRWIERNAVRIKTLRQELENQPCAPAGRRDPPS